ncbi:hypothetical protein TbrSNM41_07660 [Thermus brockianus]|uniref:Uncharacterized protein n=1 Tax=Thermus brockianus TaxID=56956 RepID=A0ABM7XIA0_THEBO|nr:hypothetical protein TbrSNM41_07660 [Thermus brockianus]
MYIDLLHIGGGVADVPLGIQEVDELAAMLHHGAEAALPGLQGPDTPPPQVLQASGQEEDEPAREEDKDHALGALPEGKGF